MRQNKGFSLVELMIVVAIIGILAAIAIPNFVAMQLKAKRSEVPGNVDGIKTSEMAYDAAFDGFIETPTIEPTASVPNKSLVDWPTANPSGWASLGWRPDGQVRGKYGAATSGSTDFLVTGLCNVDADASTATYTASKDLNAKATTAPDIY